VRKIALFAFNGEPMCFIHVLLNAIALNDKGYEVKVIIEGAACRLVPDLVKEDSPLFRLSDKARSLNLIEGVCRACSSKMGSLEAAKEHGFRLLEDMSGHPAMATYLRDGFEVITF
jgi:hypothetical protein